MKNETDDKVFNNEAFFAPLVRGLIIEKTGGPWTVAYEAGAGAAADFTVDLEAAGEKAAAENLAAEAFRLLDAAYRDNYGNALRLERVRLFETPNCWAEATR